MSPPAQGLDRPLSLLALRLNRPLSLLALRLNRRLSLLALRLNRRLSLLALRLNRRLPLLAMARDRQLRTLPLRLDQRPSLPPPLLPLFAPREPLGPRPASSRSNLLRAPLPPAAIAKSTTPPSSRGFTMAISAVKTWPGLKTTMRAFTSSKPSTTSYNCPPRGHRRTWTPAIRPSGTTATR